MQPHPIPQNVTTFQFRLVGDMTLKQFLYLAAGAGTAYLLFVFLSPIYPIVIWPLIILSALIGVAFAFLPLGSRPLDYWLKAFLKAIYSPTKRVWHKNGKTYKDDSLFNSRFITYLSTLQPHPTFAPSFQQQVILPINPAQSTPTPAPEQELPTQEELAKTVDLAKKAQALQLKILQTERTLNQIKTVANKPTAIPVDYSQQVNKILADLQILISQASSIKQQLQIITQPEQVKPEISIPQPIPKTKVKVVIPLKPKQTQLALTSFPNVINGITRDKSGNYLEGAVVVIYDKEGLPVRALKTNKLGQFTGSTPLPSGIYTLELEKENFTFDVLELELSGQILPPLLIIAK